MISCFVAAGQNQLAGNKSAGGSELNRDRRTLGRRTAQSTDETRGRGLTPFHFFSSSSSPWLRTWRHRRLTNQTSVSRRPPARRKTPPAAASRRAERDPVSTTQQSRSPSSNKDPHQVRTLRILHCKE